MRKFILKIVLFLMGVVLLTQILAYIANMIALDNNAQILQIDQQLVEELLNSAQQVEAIAIGNSHAYAIDFEALGYNGHRLARSGRDIFETKYYLEGLLPELPKVEIVFITISYFTFQRDNAVSDEVRIRRIHTYTTIPSWRYIEGDFSNFLVGKLHPIFPVTNLTREDSWESVFNTLTGKDNKSVIEEIDIGAANNHCADKGYEYIAAHADLRAVQHIQYATDMTANHPDLPLDTYNTIVEIVQELQRRNIRVVFFTPPYFYGYTEAYEKSDAAAIALMQQNMRTLQREYDIEYYDFSIDDDFTQNHQAFTDSDHLNPCSAQRFSIKLKQAMIDNRTIGETQ